MCLLVAWDSIRHCHLAHLCSTDSVRFSPRLRMMITLSLYTTTNAPFVQLSPQAFLFLALLCCFFSFFGETMMMMIMICCFSLQLLPFNLGAIIVVAVFFLFFDILSCEKNLLFCAKQRANTLFHLRKLIQFLRLYCGLMLRSFVHFSNQISQINLFLCSLSLYLPLIYNICRIPLDDDTSNNTGTGIWRDPLGLSAYRISIK